MSSAGLFWLKGALIQLGVDQALLQVWRAWRLSASADAPQTMRLWQSRELTLIAKQHTLAFLSFFKQLRRPRHLDSYNDDDLGWLSGSGTTYHASTLEHHLRELRSSCATRIRVSTGECPRRRTWRIYVSHGRRP